MGLKKKGIYAGAFLLITLLLSCSSSNGPDLDDPVHLKPLGGIAKNITLYIYSNGEGYLLDSIEIEAEGEVVIDLDEGNPCARGYYIYALANHYFTELYICAKGGSINVDLDSVPECANSIAGVIFGRQVFFADHYCDSETVNVVLSDGSSVTTMTDDQGRFGLANLPRGSCRLQIQPGELVHIFEITNNSGTDYSDFSYLDDIQAFAPVLYLYPEKEIDVQIKVDFPQGGYITKSDPPYNDGWDVHVTPKGIIDGEYEYLFYEAVLSAPLNHEVGWLLDGGNLENEFRDLLKELGFNGREIDNFMELWIPVIKGSAWYAIYPQQADELMPLNITPAPDNALRALFLLRSLDHAIAIKEPPIIEPFERNGFTAVEWGVIGWNGPVGH